MEIFRRGEVEPESLGILAGSFNPPTLAHVALAQAALERLDQVLLVIPRVMPHKEFHGATLNQRMEMLRHAIGDDPRLLLGVSDGGLMIDIGREAKQHFRSAQCYFLCGRDAAERIIGWRYNDPGVLDEMLREFQLLVAPREGVYVAPAHLSHAIHPLDVEGVEDCSSSRVREALALGDGWRSLVPERLHVLIEEIYRPIQPPSTTRIEPLT